MAGKKKRVEASFFILAFMGIVGIVWVFYTGQHAAPPLPQAGMPVVFNTKYDHSVWQVSDWLKQHVKRPETLKVLHWGRVQAVKDGYLVHVKFESKNAAGTMMMADKVFKLDADGHIAAMVDYAPAKP